MERKVSLVFSSSQEMFYREVLLSLGESRPLGMLVSCHVCGRPWLCHDHPTFLCRQFALVDTEQSRLADGEWFNHIFKSTSTSIYHPRILFLSLSPIEPEFALPSPSKQSSLGSMSTPRWL